LSETEILLDNSDIGQTVELLLVAIAKTARGSGAAPAVGRSVSPLDGGGVAAEAGGQAHLRGDAAERAADLGLLLAVRVVEEILVEAAPCGLGAAELVATAQTVLEVAVVVGSHISSDGNGGSRVVGAHWSASVARAAHQPDASAGSLAGNVALRAAVGERLNAATAVHFVVGVLGREGASAKLTPSRSTSRWVDETTVAADLDHLEHQNSANEKQEFHFLIF